VKDCVHEVSERLDYGRHAAGDLSGILQRLFGELSFVPQKMIIFRIAQLRMESYFTFQKILTKTECGGDFISSSSLLQTG
jgi:hypothetical protein